MPAGAGTTRDHIIAVGSRYLNVVEAGGPNAADYAAKYQRLLAGHVEQSRRAAVARDMQMNMELQKRLETIPKLHKLETPLPSVEEKPLRASTNVEKRGNPVEEFNKQLLGEYQRQKAEYNGGNIRPKLRP